jgi:hypothetical protein
LPDETLRPIKCNKRRRGFKKFLLQFSGLTFRTVCRCHRIFLSDVLPLSKFRRFISSKYFNFPKGTQKNGPKIIAVNRSPTSSESFCIHKTGVRLLNFSRHKSDRKRQNVQKTSNSECIERLLSGRNDKATAAVSLDCAMLTNVHCFLNSRYFLGY